MTHIFQKRVSVMLIAISCCLSSLVTYAQDSNELVKVGDIDVIINPVAGSDITEVLAAEIGDYQVNEIFIGLENGASYTISKSLVVPGNLTIRCGGLATIDASNLTDPFIVLDGSWQFVKKADDTYSDHYLIDIVNLEGVQLVGLKNSFIKDNQKTLLEKLEISNSIIEMPDNNKDVIDFNGKGYVGKVLVAASTIWAKDKNTGFFAQYGSRPKNVNGDWDQEFDVENSTIVNIANGRNFNDMKQNGTAQNVYTIKNNLFVNCGRKGNVIVGFNKGQTSATPVWDVDGNAFNWDGEDVGDAEVEKANQKDGEDIVKNTVAGVVTFKDLKNGNLNGTFTCDTEPKKKLGHSYWTLEYSVPTALKDLKVRQLNNVIYNPAGQRINSL